MEKFILSVAANTALHNAMIKRGSRKGRLLKSAPPAGTAAYAAWQGAMLHCNRYGGSFAGVMFLTPENRAIYDEVEAYFENIPHHAREDFIGLYDY